MYKNKEETRDFTQFSISDFDSHQSLSFQLNPDGVFNEDSFNKMVVELKKFIVVSKEDPSP